MQKMEKSMQKEVRVLLYNIRSAHNVGSIFRTADALGVARIYLSGYSACPIDRFGRPVKEIAKTALGAELVISWGYFEDPLTVIATCKQEGFTIVGIEQDARARDYKTFTPEGKTLVLVGSEVLGLDHVLREACDVLLEMPMRGKLARDRLSSDVGKESLNVSVAFGIALFRMLDQ
jgi:tRNA G18 (ribose-2'-O)-methylase SpoU